MRARRWRVAWVWLAAAAGLGAVSCAGKKGQVFCYPSCQSGAAICDPGGQRYACQGPDKNGCFYWRVEGECGEHQTCRAGECVCVNPCRAGEVVCGAGDTQRTCAGPDEQGCFYWEAEVACGEGQTCVGGSCGCQAPCTAGGSVCTEAGQRLSCQDPGGGECTLWKGEDPACPDHQRCSQGECACESPCAMGESICDPEGKLRTCEGPDEAGCMVWSEPKDCAAGEKCLSEYGLCFYQTPEACENANDCLYPGQSLCMTEVKYRTCRISTSGCLEWDCST